MRRAIGQGWRLAVMGAALAALVAGQVPALTAVQVLQRAAARAVADNAAIEQYAWQERTIFRTLNKDGKPPTVRTDETHWVSEVDGVQYSRLIARDGKPLSAQDEAKEARKAAEFIRKQNTPEAKAKWARQQVKEQQQGQELIAAIPKAFQVVFAPPAPDPPCDCYQLRLVPRPDFHAQDKELKLLQHLEGTVWIRRQDFGLVRGDFLFVKSAGFGWVVARIEPGSRVEMQNELVDGHWFQKSITGDLQARLFLLKRYNLQVSDVCSDYREFSVSSQVIVP